jgi:serine/threonine-protein kinase
VVWGLGVALFSGLIAILVSITVGRKVATPAASTRPSVPFSAPSAGTLADSALALGHTVAPAPVRVLQAEQITAAPAAPVLSAPPLRSPAIPIGKRRAPGNTTRPHAEPVNCNPPYRIDASGVRRVRFECL